MLSWLRGSKNKKEAKPQDKSSDQKFEQKLAVSCMLLGVGQPAPAEEELKKVLFKPEDLKLLAAVGIATSKDKIDINDKSYLMKLTFLSIAKKYVSEGGMAQRLVSGSNVLLLCPNEAKDLATFHNALSPFISNIPEMKVMIIAHNGEQFNQIVEYMKDNPAQISYGQLLLYLPTQERELALQTIIKQMLNPIRITPEDITASNEAIKDELIKIFETLEIPRVLQSLMLEYYHPPMTEMLLEHLKVKLQPQEKPALITKFNK